MKYPNKIDMPIENPYAKKRPTLDEQLKAYAESTEPVLVYDLEGYGIEELSTISFRPEVEEINLWSNKIHNPNDVTNILMKLPNLKACWLNDNPVEANCSNFTVIGNVFDKLEVFNSALTEKAGEWAMLMYAKETGAKTLEEIEYLNLAGKNLLHVSDLDFVSKMTNLKKLDISDNLDMYKPVHMLEAEARERAKGSGETNIDFLTNRHYRDELLNRLNALEHLTCDLILEVYIVENRAEKKFLPNLKTINRVSVDIINLGERTKKKELLKIMDLVWRYVGTYRLVKPGVMDEEPIFYINDEVGCAISHSDTPNTKLLPFIFSPNNKVDDPATYTYSILWPT